MTESGRLLLQDPNSSEVPNEPLQSYKYLAVFPSSAVSLVQLKLLKFTCRAVHHVVSAVVKSIGPL